MATNIDMMKTVDNPDEQEEEVKQTKHYDEMQRQMQKICELIFHYEGKFNRKEFYIAVCDYIMHNNRLLYKSISNYVYSV